MEDDHGGSGSLRQGLGHLERLVGGRRKIGWDENLCYSSHDGSLKTLWEIWRKPPTNKQRTMSCVKRANATPSTCSKAPRHAINNSRPMLSKWSSNHVAASRIGWCIVSPSQPILPVDASVRETPR